MSETSAKKFLIQDLGPIPTDILQKFRDNGLVTVQDLLDEGGEGCRTLGTDEGDIIALGEMLDEHGFDRLN